ncbi:MAG: phosphodiesterase [Syntrophorhabdaceae bacterium PtaU1.Bin034]|nr:MAG: phosphodiesterase [Syntrophorhabdaceae bacterium PtaU1.Bin034]
MTSRQDILDYTKSLACLPVLDSIAVKLSSLLAGGKVSFSRLFDIIRYDPALSSKIIAVANSAWYNRGAPVTGLKRAMMVLGIEEVKDILICSLFHDGVLKQLGLRREDIFELWRHSLLVAFAARALSHGSRKDMDKAFTAGLLHDIGKAPLQLLCHYDIRHDKTSWDSICVEERERFGADHQEIGFCIAREWNLPEDYREVIRLHHEELADSPIAGLMKKAHILLRIEPGAEDEDEQIRTIRASVKAEAGKIINIFL